jgi:hypothetical protein
MGRLTGQSDLDQLSTQTITLARARSPLMFSPRQTRSGFAPLSMVALVARRLCKVWSWRSQILKLVLVHLRKVSLSSFLPSAHAYNYTAISRRGGRGGGFGNRGGNRGGRDNRDDEQQQQPRREQRERRYDDRPPPPRQQRQERHQQPMDNYMPEPVTVGPPPPVPTFGAPLPGFPYNFH